MSGNTPVEAIEALCHAIEAVDSEGAEDQCTLLGWASRRDSARVLYKQCTRKKLSLRPCGEARIQSDRAAVPTELWKQGRKVDAEWLLLLREGDCWLVEAVSSCETHAALFVRGVLPALLDVGGLPESPGARRWAERRLAALRAETLDEREEVVAVWDVAVLGDVPNRPRGAPTAADLAPWHQIVEALGEAPSPWIVTSSIPGEGKSTTAAHLASAAAASRRVLLVDADLRLPSQQRRFSSIAPVHGLSEILEDRTTIPEQIVATALPGLSLLCAGRPPEDPEALLDGDVLTHTLETLRTAYDLVVIDTPPAGRFDDALAVLRHSAPSTCLVVVEPGVLHASELEVTRDRLEQAGITPAGLLLVGAGSSEWFARAREQAIEHQDLEISLVGTRALRAASRVAVGFTFRRPSEPLARAQWVVLHEDPASGDLTPVSEATVLTPSTLLAKLAPDWPPETLPAPPETEHVPAPTADEVVAILRAAAASALRDLGFEGTDLAAPDFSQVPPDQWAARAPELVTRWLSALVVEGHTPAETQPATPDAEVVDTAVEE